MTNQAHIMKWETAKGIARFRLWIDDERGEHLAVAELEVTWARLLAMAIECQRVAEREAQLPLWE